MNYIQYLALLVLASLVGWFGTCALAGPQAAQEGMELFLAVVGKSLVTLLPFLG